MTEFITVNPPWARLAVYFKHHFRIYKGRIERIIYTYIVHIFVGFANHYIIMYSGE